MSRPRCSSSFGGEDVMHASLELIEAMIGRRPNLRANSELPVACGLMTVIGERVWHWWFNSDEDETSPDLHSVNCPGCLVAIDAALEGVVLKSTEPASLSPQSPT